MKSKFLLVALVVFMFFNLTGHSTKSQQPSSSSAEMIPASFKLVLHWPSTLCNTGHSVLATCKRPIPRQFTIKGLWGFDNSGKPIPHCEHGTLLLMKELDYIRSALEQEWPNLLGGNFELWAEEWKKHGRCLSGMTPKTYFHTAINLMEQIGPLLDLLDGTVLSLDTNQRHSTHDFPTAIQNQIHATTEIKCNKDLHGRSQMHEVFFCSSTHGVLLNCSNDARNVYKIRNCPPKILFPLEPPAPALALPLPPDVPLLAPKVRVISARLNFRVFIAIFSLHVIEDNEGLPITCFTLSIIPK